MVPLALTSLYLERLIFIEMFFPQNKMNVTALSWTGSFMTYILFLRYVKKALKYER